MVQDIVPGGSFLLNCGWNNEEIEKHLPGQVKDTLRKTTFISTIDGVSIAKSWASAERVNTILQAAFFKIANIIPVDDAVKFMKNATASYSKKVTLSLQ